MARKYKVTAMILVICMCVMTMFPEEAMAQETQQGTTEQQEQQTTTEEDEAAILGSGADDSLAASEDSQSDDADEMAEEMEEELQTAEDDDPGQGRLSGDIPADFYGEGLKTRASSSQITHNSKFASYTKYHGIDVSKWNKSINWSKVKAAGISFAFVRVGYRGYSGGGLGGDEYAATNMKNAAAAGVKVGAYIFSQAITEAEAREEADYILSKVKGYNITMPIVFDFEYYSGGRLEKANLSKRKQTDICLAFCERVAAAGYTPMVYANKSMLTSDLYASEISAKYPIWLAHYTNKTDYTGTYTYWQYSSTGTVNGISGNVDMNYWYVEPGSSLDGTVGADSSGSSSAVTLKKTTLSGSAASFDSVKLSWKKVSGAKGYIIYRYNSSSKSYKRIKVVTNVNTLSYTDGSKNASTTYKYKVKAYKKSGGKTYYSSASNAVSVKTSGSATGKTTGTSVNVRSGPSTSKSILTTLGISEGVTLTGSTGNWYRISIKIKGKKKTGYISKDYVTIIKKPTLKVSALSSSKITLKWNKISGADGYQIQKYNSTKKKWETLKTIKSGSTVSYTNSGLKKNTTYKYRIRSYKIVKGRKIYSYYCNAKSAKTKK